ncbi:MAG: histidine phosphatase family protein [Myxococcales bacterium]|nr:histidine phosphatase family protein [Myxococcales bacterium]
MSTLLVIRHGQASFGAADYDVLSSRGEEQSRRLGAYLERAGVRPDVVITGPRARQIDTARHMSSAPAFADATVEPRFDEFPAFEIVAAALPTLLASGELSPARRAAYEAAARDPVRERQGFEDMFRDIMRRWAEDDPVLAPALAELESFAAFRARVLEGMRALMRARGRGRTIVVVTSAGTVGASLAAALSLSPWDSIKASLVVANTAITTFKYRDPADVSLGNFNAHPHLTDRALVTLR